MKSFKSRAAGDDTESPSGKPKVTPRKDYRCAAYGCPNAGSINDGGVNNRGLCGKHWGEPADGWAAITTQILRSGERNWGEQPPRKSSKLVEEMRGKMRNADPVGVVNALTGARL